MKRLFSYLYHQTTIGQLVLNPFRNLWHTYLNHPVIFIRRSYKQRQGVFPNLKKPTLLSEKIQWLKLYDQRPIYNICADKYRVREYVTKRGGEKCLVPLIFVTENPLKIDFDALPESFVMKANHTSGDVLLVPDKTQLNRKEAIATCKRWLARDFFEPTKEWSYKNIKRMVVIEELLPLPESGCLDDYKVHCINGKVEFIEVMIERFSGTGIKERCYDPEWNELPFVFSYPKSERAIEKPERLDELLKLATDLSAEFPYVRVDCYLIGGNLYFGEMTFYPHSGWDMYMLRNGSNTDRELGEKLILPEKTS